MVVSQDCDIIHGSIEGEPYAEVLFAHKLEGCPDGSFTYGKNPRRLQFAITSERTPQYHECLAQERYILDRRILVDFAADPANIIESSSLYIVRNWLAARYTRTAFPDEFNARIANELRRQSRTLKARGNSLSGIYVAVTPWEELGDSDVYRVELYATVETDVWSDSVIRSEMETLISDIATAMNSCEGIEVENFELRSEDAITLADLRFLRRWDYDYLSHRDSADSALPPQ
jgi:hypothetical protein